MSNAWVMQPIPMTVTSSNTASGYSAANVADDRMGLVWKSTSVAAPKLSIDLGATPPPIDWIMLFGVVPGGATLMRVRSSDDSGFATVAYDSGTFTLLAGLNLPSHGYGVGWWNGTAQTKRYWEITFSAASGNVTPQIARLAMGQHVSLGVNYVVGAGYGAKSMGAVDFNRYGSLLRSRGAKMRTIGISYTYVTKDEFQNSVQPLIEVLGADEPIVLCTDPAVDPNRQKRCYIGPPTGDLGTVHRQLNGWEWKLQLTDLVAVAAGTITLPLTAPSYLLNYALALNFDNQRYWDGVTYSASVGAMTGYSFTRSGTAIWLNAAGGLDSFAANVPAINGRGLLCNDADTNILLNAGGSGNLSTQSVTTSAQKYTLSWIGTGQITLTGTMGASYGGAPTATGRVAYAFTPTAGTLTLTVSGSCTYAVLMAGDFTEDGPIVTTAGTTASIGISDLRMTDAIADVDQLLLAQVYVPSVRPTTTNDIHGRIAAWGSANNILFNWSGFSTTASFAVNSGGALSVNSPANLTAGKTYVLVAQRVAGKWRAGHVVDGILTWWAAASSVAWNSPNSSMAIGTQFGGNVNDSPIKFVGRKLGTYAADSDVLAAAAEIT